MRYWHLQLTAYLTIVRKEIRRFTRIWVQTITPPAVNALLYMLIFGGLIGSRIREVDGFAYMDFLVPGIIMMGIITNSYGNVVSSFFGTKLQKYIEELLVSPVSNATILAGYVTGGVARGIAVGAVVSLVALFFTDLIYSINMLPPFAQKLSLFNPVLYMINGFRYGILGVSDIPLWQSFAVIFIFIALLSTIAMTLLNRGIGIKA